MVRPMAGSETSLTNKPDSEFIIKTETKSRDSTLGPIELEGVGKPPDARHLKSRGMRRTYKYAAVTRDEDNTADGVFPTPSYFFTVFLIADL